MKKSSKTKSKQEPKIDVSFVMSVYNKEYYLPSVVTELLEEEKATVTVLTSKDKWYGVTYKEDKPVVEGAIRDMIKFGKYPSKLWK